MAILFPPLEKIHKLKVVPTPGEEHLLIFLQDNLDDTYEIYFQSFLNGDRPDIVLMRKDSGVMVIEVKDWNLKDQWFIKTNKNPINQVLSYKENLFNLHIKELLELKLENHNFSQIVSCVIYFHKAEKKDLRLLENIRDSKANTRDFDFFDSNSLTKENFLQILHNKLLDGKSEYFNETLYESFKRYLQPPMHTIEQGSEIHLSKKQNELIVSRPIQQKIKGVAGSGKTLLLARRAVNAHKRTKNKILILTFNISLKNYIHDKISEVREEFHWENFHIINYHQFFKSQANNHGLKHNNKFEDELFFEKVKHEIIKYDAIFIDEVQDYKVEWLKIINNYFLSENGEFVLFGDEKQNIYKRDLEDKKIKTNVKGRWNELNESFRLNTKIANIAQNFQNFFFLDRYELDDIKYVYQQTLNYDNNPHLEYHFYQNDNLEDIFNKINEIIVNLKIHPNDIGILSTKRQTIRELDFFIKNKKNEKTEIMCETREIFDSLIEKGWNKKLQEVRRNKKFHFWMNPGMIKLSTIHSFKGWEIHTLFLIIEKYPENEETLNVSLDELIYTGITRSRSNLFIINIGNNKYDKFFKTIIRKG